MAQPGGGSGAGRPAGPDPFPGVKHGSGVPGLGERRQGFRNSRTVVGMAVAGAAAVAATWIVSQRGGKVPTVAHEGDKQRFSDLHQGPHVANAPKAVAQPGEAQGHSEALKPRIPGAS